MCASVCLNLCVCLVWKYSHSWLLIPLVFGAGVKTTVAQCKVSDPLLWFEHIFNSWYVVAVVARASKKGSKGRVCTDLSWGVVVRFGGFLLHTTIPGKMSCSQKFQQNFQDWPSACFFYSFLRHFIVALWKKMTVRPGQCKMKQVEKKNWAPGNILSACISMHRVSYGHFQSFLDLVWTLHLGTSTGHSVAMLWDSECFK